jgi:hypothetical protein
MTLRWTLVGRHPAVAFLADVFIIPLFVNILYRNLTAQHATVHDPRNRSGSVRSSREFHPILVFFLQIVDIDVDVEV